MPRELALALAQRIARLARGQSAQVLDLPGDLSQDTARLFEEVNRFLADHELYASLLQDLSRGELDRQGPKSLLAMASSYKALQAHLRHLTWAAGQIAAGDFSQRVDFMGEFSAAFNKMATDLDAAFQRIEEQNLRLTELNTRLGEHVEALTQAKRDLSESEAKLAHIVADAHEAIVLVDRQGCVVHWNPAAERLFGYTAREIMGLAIQEHIAAPTERRFFTERFPELLMLGDDKAGERTEMSAMRRDGSLFPVEVSFSRTELGGAPHGLVIFRDITERWKLEALKREVERMTHHDLKSPLNAVIGLPRLLAEEPGLSDDARESLQLISEAGYDMLNIVNLSLGMYKMETKSYVLTAEPLDLAALAQRVLLEQTPQARAGDKSFELLVDGEPYRPEHRVYAMGEPLLCYSMLGNLVKNALEASPRGGRVRLDLANDGVAITLGVHNQGAVPEAVRDRLFTKYVTSGKTHGTGLGVYSARLMARVQQGDVSFETSDTRGTTFRVTLPSADSAFPL